MSAWLISIFSKGLDLFVWFFWEVSAFGICSRDLIIALAEQAKLHKKFFSESGTGVIAKKVAKTSIAQKTNKDSLYYTLFGLGERGVKVVAGSL